MAITWTDATLNAQADEDAARCVYVSLHTGDPGSAGDNEATGGSPAYARLAAGWSAANTEGPLGADQPATVGVVWCTAVFDLPAGDYTHYGYWSAVTGGTFHGGGPLPSDVTLSSQGTQQVSIAEGPQA